MMNRQDIERLPRFGVVDGVVTPHPKGTMVRLDDVLALANPDRAGLRAALCRYAGENRGWCLVHDAEWRIDRAVCEGAPDRADPTFRLGCGCISDGNQTVMLCDEHATPDRANPCPACNGEPMSPDCAICGGSGLATPDRADPPAPARDDVEWLVRYARKQKGPVAEVAQQALDENPGLRPGGWHGSAGQG